MKGGRGRDRSFGDRPPSRQYNSTNAPPSYNNRPVPMDVGRAKGWRKGPTQGNAATPAQASATPAKDNRPQRPPKFQGDCWHCQKPRHTMKECRKLQREKAATTTTWEQPAEGQLVDWQPADNRTNPIDAIIKSFAALSTEEQDELAARFQESEDFQDA